MNDSKLISEQFEAFNYVNTNWCDFGMKYDEDSAKACRKFFVGLLSCAKCENLVVDCNLEDKLRGFGDDDDSKDKYLELHVCM